MTNIVKNTIEKIRCMHRHDINKGSHEACFAQGNVVDKRKDKSIPWYQEPGLKIGYLDIESDGLNADFGTMLSWCIKEKGGVVYNDVITKDELFKGVADKNLVKNLIDRMRDYRILVTYYGTGFDIPFIRAKALHYGLEFPSYGEIYHFDVYYTVKSKLALSRKSLDSACDYLNIKGKTPIDKEAWRTAKYGDPKALDLVLEHNIADVAILEQLHDKLTPFAKWTKRST